MSFANKTVLVIGASSGIGAATAILFAEEGANVAMVGRNVTKLNNVAGKVAKVGKTPLVIIADISKDNDVKKIINETIAKFSKLDVLVNNAGVVKCGSIADGTIVDSYDGMFDINVRAIINLTSLAAPHLIKTKGNIVNISSASSNKFFGSNYLIYAVSKAALDHFTKGAANDLAPHGVRVNSINPGPVKTDILDGENPFDWKEMESITALGRVSDPIEIANFILYIAGDKAQGFTGSILVADNGYLVK